MREADRIVFENDDDQFEAKDYFADLKEKVNKITCDRLEAAQAIIAEEIEKARSLGQTNLAHKSAYMWTVIKREFALHALGYDDYVLVDDVTRLIDKVTPKNSVKAVELSRYPRTVPWENAQAIKKALELDIFDEMVVVYTDFADEEVATKEEKAMVARNTDPVVFGMFRNKKLNMNHSRLYFITDWEDEFCDLTFARMVEKMSSVGIANPAKKLTGDMEHINRVAAEALTELGEGEENGSKNVVLKNNAPYKKGWFAKLKGLFAR